MHSRVFRTVALAALVAATASSGRAQTTSLPAASAEGTPASAGTARQDAVAPLRVIHFEALNPGEPSGDRLTEVRRIAAAIVAQDNPSPKSIVDVGSFTGEFLVVGI